MAGESQCMDCGMFYNCLNPGAKLCREEIEKEKRASGQFVLKLQATCPTRSVLQTLEREILAWAQHHNIEIKELDLKQAD